MRRLLRGWNTLLARLGRVRITRLVRSEHQLLKRSLRIESLEDRRVLAPVTVNTLTDVQDSPNLTSISALIANPGPDLKISLREAIRAANADAAHDTISFSVSGTISLTATGHDGQLAIENGLTIQGPGAGSLSIQAFDPDPALRQGNGERIFDIMDSFNGASPPLVQISGVTLFGADVGVDSPIGRDGGAIRSAGLLSLSHCTISGNSADRGGGVFVEVAGGGEVARNVLTIEDCIIENNEAVTGGGIQAVVGQINVQSNDVVGITRSLIRNNDAVGGSGAGLHLDVTANSAVVISHSTFTQNTSVASGGGIFLDASGSAEITLVKSTLTGNVAQGFGGGVATYLKTEAVLSVADSQLSGNEATSLYGGALWAHVNYDGEIGADRQAITISRSTLSDNSAGTRGGGLYIKHLGGTQILVEDSRITGNATIASTGNGGGVYAYLVGSSVVPDGKFIISRSTLDDNTAGSKGGGIFVCSKFGGSFLAVNSTFSGNRTLDDVNGEGGGLIIAHTEGDGHLVNADLRNVTITNNRSANGGGLRAVDLPDTQVRFANSIISQNFNHAGSAANNLVGRVDVANIQYNLIGTGSAVLDLNGNPALALPATNINSDTPMLSALGNHGGPTPTHIPLNGSDAIDAGSNPLAVVPLTSPAQALLTDQRGVPYARSVDLLNVPNPNGPNNFVDIGAVELAASSRVVDVVVKRTGTNPWAGEHSFADKISRGEQYRPIATQGANTIEIHFDSPVTLSANALKLAKTIRNTAGPNAPPAAPSVTDGNSSGVMFDSSEAANFIYRWVFPASGAHSLEDGKYALFLPSHAVTGSGGQHLDGEWDNSFGGSSHPTADVFADDVRRDFVTGDGIPSANGGAFRLNFGILVGDYTGGGSVGGDDMLLWQQLLGADWSYADGTGDGSTDEADWAYGSVFRNNIYDYLAMRRATGDLYDDDILDNRDLSVLRMNIGLGADGDLNGDGLTDGTDLLIWQQVLVFGSFSAWTPSYDLPAVLASVAEETPLPAVGDLAPFITDVIVSGSNSTHTPHSLASVDGSGAQIASVPVGGADTITIVFSEAVNVLPDSLYVVGIKTRALPTFAEFSYDAVTHAATWRFENWWHGDQYMLVMPDDVTDATGNRLDGEWVNPFAYNTTNAAVSEFPSGDGEAGGGFAFVITLYGGDVNQSNVVNSPDLAIVQANLGMTTGATFSQGDLDGDGDVDSSDVAAVHAYWSWWGSLESVNWFRSDLNSDGRVDDLDFNIITLHAGMTGATWYEGDLNDDGQVTQADLDIAFAQSGPWWDWYQSVA